MSSKAKYVGNRVYLGLMRDQEASTRVGSSHRYNINTSTMKAKVPTRGTAKVLASHFPFS